MQSNPKPNTIYPLLAIGIGQVGVGRLDADPMELTLVGRLGSRRHRRRSRSWHSKHT
jgi:hypothetical protein